MSQPVLLALTAFLSAALGGAGIWGFLTARMKLAASREDGEIGRLRADLAESKLAHRACEERLDALEVRLGVVEHHHNSFLPRWIKDSEKRLTWINAQALVTIFAPVGFSRTMVIGHTFEELLDPAAAREIDRLDRSALAVPGQPASMLLQLAPTLPPMIVVKVAGVGRDGELIYEGYAFCPNDPSEARHRQERRQEEQMGMSRLRLAGPDAAEAGQPPAA